MADSKMMFGAGDEPTDTKRKATQKEIAAYAVVTELHEAVDAMLQIIAAGRYTDEMMQLLWLKCSYLESQHMLLDLIAEKADAVREAGSKAVDNG